MSPVTTQAPLRLGLVGVDSPHAPSFARLLGDGVHGAVAGARVTHAWPGDAAPDFPLARDRVGALAETVAGLGVTLLDSPEAVAAQVDAVLVVASDARTHPGYVHRVLDAGRPVYVDTRFALTVADARGMLDAARAAGVVLHAGSPKRFTPEARAALAAARAAGPVTGVALDGALPTQPGHPVLDWYGFHLVDLAVAALGPGCAVVDAPDGGPVTLVWEDGRTATLDGGPAWAPWTRGVLHDAAGGRHELAVHADEPMLVGLLEALVEGLRTGAPTVPHDEVLAVVAVVEAARASRAAGRPVTVRRDAAARASG